MDKRITRAEDLPDWFDPGKYSGAIHLDARGWLEQLSARRVCYMAVWYLDEPHYLQESDVYGFPPADLLAALRETPIFPYNGSRFDRSLKSRLGYDEMAKAEQPSTPPGIKRLTPSDIASSMLQMKPKRQKEFLRWLDIKRIRFSSNKNREKPPPEYPDWFFEPVPSRPYVQAVLDVSVPRKLLDRGFDLFVSKERERIKDYLIQKDQRANTFLEWCNCGLLQYIDLMIWSIQEDTTITNKALAYGIFPNNYEKGEEDIRKTTQKHALNILDDGIEVAVFMSRLRSYAALEDYLENAPSE